MIYSDRIRIDSSNSALDAARSALGDPERIQAGDVVAELDDRLRPTGRVGTVVMRQGSDAAHVRFGMKPRKTSWLALVVGFETEIVRSYRLKVISSSKVRAHPDTTLGIEVHA